MPDFALVNLSTLEIIGTPGTLPRAFIGLSTGSLADLSFTGPDLDGAYVGKGLWPVVPVRPDPAWWQRNADTPELVVDEEGARVTATYALEPRPLADVKAARRAGVTAKRQEIEVAGFLWVRTVGEAYYIATDEKSQSKIDAERAAAKDEVRRPGDKWKCGDPQTGREVFVSLSDAEIVAMSTAARNRTSDAFNREGELHALIDACTTAADVAAIDIDSGWPS